MHIVLEWLVYCYDVYVLYMCVCTCVRVCVCIGMGIFLLTLEASCNASIAVRFLQKLFKSYSILNAPRKYNTAFFLLGTSS